MLDPHTLLTHSEVQPVESFDWGTLQWLANGAILPGTTQTLGLCHLFAGKRNPPHYHPNCEEILFVQAGQGRHLLDKEWVPVRPGSVVRIPIGMKHQLINEGPDSLVTLIVFSSADRRTVFLDEV